MFYNIEPTLDWKTLKLLHLGWLKHDILNYDLNKFNNIEPTPEWSTYKYWYCTSIGSGLIFVNYDRKMFNNLEPTLK